MTSGDCYHEGGARGHLIHGTKPCYGLCPPENLRRREERTAYAPTRLPEFVPDRAAILYGLRQHGIDAPQSVGIKQETMRKLLDGSTRRPTASLMMQLARLFDCEVEDLMREARDGDD